MNKKVVLPYEQAMALYSILNSFVGMMVFQVPGSQLAPMQELLKNLQNAINQATEVMEVNEPKS